MSVIVINAATSAHKEGIEKFGNAIGADRIEYIDRGKGEDYIITINGKKVTIKIDGNQYDGGYVNFYVGE